MTICGIRFSVIDKANKDSTKEPNNETASDNKEGSIEGSGFSGPSPDTIARKGIDSGIGGALLIDSQ